MINCEWGVNGIRKFSEQSDITIIVDVLSFSTAVDIAVSSGAEVFPYRYKDETAVQFAKSKNIFLASFERSHIEYSLSPLSLKNIKKGTKLVLPSPNGSELSMESKSSITLCSSLRNFKAVARYASGISDKIAVIPAGEKWEDGTARFAVEDLIGAGAVISQLKGELSSESEAAVQFFKSITDINRMISNSVSAVELMKKGFHEDVSLATEIGFSTSIPQLKDGRYINQV